LLENLNKGVEIMGFNLNGEAQTLQDILNARDKRVQFQQYLLQKYKSAIVSYKLNIPGPVKYNPLIRRIFDEGLQVFKKKLNELSIVIRYEEAFYENSGPEYFAVFESSSNISTFVIKKVTVYIEETHPLGRLYDMDIVDASGKIFSREELGIGLRKCLICGNNAFACGRSRSHSIEELTEKIERMASEYFKENY
jgi:holo-ACP synthase